MKSNKHILVITTSNLAKPMTGTPIRICKFIEQMAARFRVTVIAKSLDEHPGYEFIASPVGSFIKRYLFYRRFIKENEVDYIFTPASSDLKMVVALRLTCGVKAVADIHGVAEEEEYYFGFINFFQKKYRGWFFSFLYSCFDRVFVVSEKMRSYYGFSDIKALVVYGGVEMADFPYSYNSGREKTFEILYMGNSRPYQGFELLLQSLTLIPDLPYRLHLIMTGGLEKVEAMLAEKGLRETTSIEQNVAHTEIAGHLNGASILVIPRPAIPMTEYAYPSKLSECLATGIPVLATDVGPVKEIMENKVNGIVVTANNPSALAEGIRELYTLDSELLVAMGKKARSLVESKLTWNKLGETICQGFE